MNEGPRRLSAASLRALSAITQLRYRSHTITDRADLARIVPALFCAPPRLHASVGAIDAVPLEVVTTSGTFVLDLVNVAAGRAGIAAGDGVVFHTKPELAALLAIALQKAQLTEPSPAPAAPAEPAPPGVAVPPPGNVVRVVFYALDHNQQYAQLLQQEDPDHTVIVPLGPGSSPQYCHDQLDTIHNTNPVGQIIFASHGAAAVFQAGPIPQGVGDATNVGMYQGNVTPQAFGQMIQPLLRADATITLLTCSTIASVPGADGVQLMHDLAAAAQAWVIGCDDTVLIYTGQVANATTTGNVWRCEAGQAPAILNANPNPGVDEIAVPIAPVVPLYAIAGLAAA